MRVIALDTTTRAGSIALLEDDRVIDERVGDASRTHAERLPAEIMAIADAHGVALSDVDLYAVASGPGSFTGLRIGIATVQGLAIVHRRRIVGIPALEALAHARSGDLPEGTLVAAWMDAHRRDVFAAIYRVAAGAPFSAGRLEAIGGPTVGDPASTLARWIDDLGVRPTVFVGDGAAMYESVIRCALAGVRVFEAPPIAATIGRLAIARASQALDPGDVRPLYVRRPDAEIARDRIDANRVKRSSGR
jgi:tRNA threonylcarbamoyladenosine biosynthesis protein TsaB